MDDFNPEYRKWGYPPYNTVLLHGGPGAAGSVTSLANLLGQHIGVIEPFQKGTSIQAQINELLDIIKREALCPVVLVGHSWGAWLGIIFASNYPEIVEKLILIGTPPFEEKYVLKMRRIREERIRKQKKDNLLDISNDLKLSQLERFRKMGEMMTEIDSYHLLPIHDKIDFRADIYFSIWNEAIKLRSENHFFEFASKISCPVVAIHGNYDPHPWLGVKNCLAKWFKEFDFVLLKKCGHYPWKEKFVQGIFIEILLDKIK
jgi:pimeloyl-ACP methyl ester carboxylesterase